MMVCGSDGHYTKNALHLAAWKGDIRSVQLLIDTGIKYKLDLVNIISTGIGNYGKTPIFYAITQDRDDVVRLLIESGSNLLIVNNKGQTPCSLSMAHLSIGTQKLLFEEEKKQLLLDGKFMNYRVTHNDHRRYGDLDPRFPIDFDNWDVDIEKELIDFSAIDLYSSDIHPYIFDNFPRCVRRTTFQTRLVKAMENRLKLPIDAIVEKQFRHLPPITMKQNEYEIEENEKCDACITSRDIETFYPDVKNKIIFIETYEDLKLFALDVNSYMNTALNEECSESIFIQRSWALDCEWKPTLSSDNEHPVSILQLSRISVSYILDLQSMCTQPKSNGDFIMSESEILLNEILVQIFTDQRFPIVGFDTMNDLERLAGSYPHIPCFSRYESVIDIRDLASKIPNSSQPTKSPSLKTLVKTILQKDLDKSLQCSDWSQVSTIHTNFL